MFLTESTRRCPRCGRAALNPHSVLCGECVRELHDASRADPVGDSTARAPDPHA